MKDVTYSKSESLSLLRSESSHDVEDNINKEYTARILEKVNTITTTTATTTTITTATTTTTTTNHTNINNTIVRTFYISQLPFLLIMDVSLVA
jgi:hypothetical protein